MKTDTDGVWYRTLSPLSLSLLTSHNNSAKGHLGEGGSF